jgi:transposase-like protein
MAITKAKIKKKKDEAYRLYVSECYSLDEIAKATGAAKTTLLSWKDKYNWEMIRALKQTERDKRVRDQIVAGEARAIVDLSKIHENLYMQIVAGTVKQASISSTSNALIRMDKYLADKGIGTKPDPNAPAESGIKYFTERLKARESLQGETHAEKNRN